MPIKSTIFKITIDEESGTFLTSFVTNNGKWGDPEVTRNITLFTWKQVGATVALARKGKLESNAEVSIRNNAGRSELIKAETVEQYLARGGRITRFQEKFQPPADDDAKGWDKLLDEIVDEVEMENPVGYTAEVANLAP